MSKRAAAGASMRTDAVPSLSKTTPREPMPEHAIRLRAHELYVQRGRAEGHAVDDWLAAEAELLYGHSTSEWALVTPAACRGLTSSVT